MTRRGNSVVSSLLFSARRNGVGGLDIFIIDRPENRPDTCESLPTVRSSREPQRPGASTDQKPLFLADIEWLTWSPRFREYGPATVMCQGYTMASTTSQDRKLSITLCPRYFSYPRCKDTLQPWRSGQRTIAAGTNMAVALSSPATFLHELMHMTTRSSKEAPEHWTTLKILTRHSDHR
jgi:hypothetical protein